MSLVYTIGKGIAWNVSAVTIGKIVGFVNLFVILSNLSVYEYGLTELTMSVGAIFGLFLLPGLTSIVTVDLGVERAQRDFSAMKALFLEFVTVQMMLGIIAWAALFFGSSLVAHWTGNDLINHFFKITSFLFLTAPLRTATTMLATVSIRYLDQSFFPVVEEIAKGFFLFLFLYVLERGASGLLFALVFAQLAAILVFVPRTISAFREFSHAPTATSKPLWHILRMHRKWGVLSAYIGTSATSIRLFVLKLMLGTEAVGIYSFAVGFLNQLSGLLPLGPIVGPLIPRFINRPDELLRLMRASIRLHVGIAFGLMLLSALAVPLIVDKWFPHYQASVPIFYFLLPALLPLAVMSIYTPVFLALKEQRSQMYSSVFKFAVDVVTLPILIMSFGILGTGLHSVVVATATAIERYVRLKRLLPSFVLHFSDFWYIDPLEREALATVFAQIRRVTTWTSRV